MTKADQRRNDEFGRIETKKKECETKQLAAYVPTVVGRGQWSYDPTEINCRLEEEKKNAGTAERNFAMWLTLDRATITQKKKVGRKKKEKITISASETECGSLSMPFPSFVIWQCVASTYI